MGNAATHGPSAAARGKVILSNGDVFTYDRPITAAELMLEHPQELVVEFPAVAAGKRPAPLPADQKLDPRKTYLMIPKRRGRSAPLLSSDEARELLGKTNFALKSKALLAYTGFVPLFVRICPAGGVKNGAVLNVGREDEGKIDYFKEILEGRPEFLSRQVSGKGWKPSLDPITEKAINAKVRHWMF
ncbi:multidrug resistance protein ABC transporter [Striga asiatica]|uniref:Multidrug resistance protein ABC transporter n=1 Tax=Striga asiatica TaxID=4170 RepID=A0A5A7QHH6_STRAF|nr:multidrug resistance protein ABC transporter [Striga asiatica]